MILAQGLYEVLVYIPELQASRASEYTSKGLTHNDWLGDPRTHNDLLRDPRSLLDLPAGLISPFGLLRGAA